MKILYCRDIFISSDKYSWNVSTITHETNYKTLNEIFDLEKLNAFWLLLEILNDSSLSQFAINIYQNHFHQSWSGRFHLLIAFLSVFLWVSETLNYPSIFQMRYTLKQSAMIVKLVLVKGSSRKLQSVILKRASALIFKKRNFKKF